MTEPNIEEIVVRFERTATMSVEDTVHLIASWRARGEALKEARYYVAQDERATETLDQIDAALAAESASAELTQRDRARIHEERF